MDLKTPPCRVGTEVFVLNYFLGAAAHRSASQPLENCLRAVRHGPHFVQSTKPQFSGVGVLRKNGDKQGLVIEVQPVKKRGFPLAGNAGRAVWPASVFSGVRMESGHLGSCPFHSRDFLKKIE